jgi:predicted dehydrogenase
LIGGTRQMIVFDELEPDEKIKIYDRGVDLYENPEAKHQYLVNYRAGDMWAPRLDRTEALKVATRQFVDCISAGRPPLTDGAAGYRVVALLEAAGRSIAAGGVPVSVPAAVR